MRRPSAHATRCRRQFGIGGGLGFVAAAHFDAGAALAISQRHALDKLRRVVAHSSWIREL